MTGKRSGRTSPVVEEKTAPRLPHERDESSDSQQSAPRPVIQQAHDDLAAGRTDTDRGAPMNDAYQRQKEPKVPPKKSKSA